MRILFLNPIGSIGGAERVLLTAVAGVKRECPSAVVRVVALSDGPLLAMARELGAETEIAPLPNGFGELGDSRSPGNRRMLLARSLTRLPALWPFIGRLRARIARFKPDLVHSNGIKTHLLSPFAVSRAVPVIWHVHDFYGLRPLAGWLLRRSRSRVQVAVAISNAVAVDAKAVLPGIPVEVVPNAVDLTRFLPGPGDGDELDRQAGLPPAPPGTVRVGLIATYARWKGHLTVLDAAARLATESPALPIRWYIVGGPIYQTAAQFTLAELRDAATARGLAGRVGFVPFTADPVSTYGSLDVVLHASTLPEPFGLTVAEGMACGRAVIVSAAGGAAELFTEDVDAVAFTSGHVDQLVSVVRRLVENSGLRARLGEAARRTAETRFDAHHYGQRLCQVYRSVLGSH
ncbi:MAG: glycosyltransferase family 4 protein [Planctomycetes bacterium]|nr:glycosyltransferase family 4 protein [Planctomycetota bacterium]